MRNIIKTHYGLRGFYSWEEVDEKSGIILRKSPNKNNLILNQGIDFIAVNTFIANIGYCAIGTSFSPPLLSDTGLGNEINRTNTLDNQDTVIAATTLSGNVFSLTKVFKFTANKDYYSVGELGWSPSAVAGNNLFSKVQMVDQNGTPGIVTITAGKYLRVKYTLQITITPNVSTAGSSNITGWSSNTGNYSVQYIGLQGINTDGNLIDFDAGGTCNEPSVYSTIFFNTDSTALAGFGSAVARSGTTYTKTASVTYNGSGLLLKRCGFSKTDANSSTLRCAGIGPSSSPEQNSGFVFVFNSNQTKDSNNILRMIFTYTWSRNP